MILVGHGHRNISLLGTMEDEAIALFEQKGFDETTLHLI